MFMLMLLVLVLVLILVLVEAEIEEETEAEAVAEAAWAIFHILWGLVLVMIIDILIWIMCSKLDWGGGVISY